MGEGTQDITVYGGGDHDENKSSGCRQTTSVALPADSLIGLAVVQTDGYGPWGDSWTDSPFDPDLCQGWYNVDGGDWIPLPSVAGWSPNNIFRTYVSGHTAGTVLVDTWSFQLTPEPATLAVLGIGAALALLRRRRA